MNTIGIIEDVADFRDLLTTLFEKTNGIKVLFSVESTEDAIKYLINNIHPSVCIIDINLPGSSGIELVTWIQKNAKSILCLICTAYDSSSQVFQSLEAGAHGYILKSTSPSGIVGAVKDLLDGGSPMSSEIARKVVTTFRKKQNPDIEILTAREKEVLEVLAQGLLYKEIASMLSISIDTVKRHCFNIYDKLHVQNRTEAINKLLGR